VEECKGARAELARGLVGWSMEFRGAEEDYRVRSTEDGKMAVQRCKAAYGLCKGGKVS